MTYQVKLRRVSKPGDDEHLALFGMPAGKGCGAKFQIAPGFALQIGVEGRDAFDNEVIGRLRRKIPQGCESNEENQQSAIHGKMKVELARRRNPGKRREAGEFRFPGG